MEKTILAAQPVQPVAHTRPVTCCQTEFKYGGNSLREKPAAKGVNRAPPPRGEADPTPFGTQRCQKGMLLESVRRCVMAKSERCVQGPCETCETLSSPSMISAPLCTKLEMSDINWSSFIATVYHPPCRNAERRFSLLSAHFAADGEKRSWFHLVSVHFACRICLEILLFYCSKTGTWLSSLLTSHLLLSCL